MKASRFFAALVISFAFAFMGCEQHSFEETSKLHQGHGGGHGDGHGDHGHDSDGHGEKGHDDHGKHDEKSDHDSHAKEGKDHDTEHKEAKPQAEKKAKGEARDLGL